MLTHGALAATRRCVASLRAHTRTPFQLFVVDNASTDGTVEWLRERREPWLHHRCNAHNRGVPGGRNDLLDFVLPHACDTDWIVFIDNDLEFGADWFAPFAKAIDSHPDARLFGKVGHFLTVGESGRTLYPAPVDTSPVDVLSGGFACFTRVDAARAIGRFDERLGRFWHEDDDWCVRALQCGFDVIAVPESDITHHEHGSGVAIADLPSGGSLANQRYLAQKWRAAGFLDEQGWVRRARGPWLPPAVCAELQRRCGRATPIGRTELACAITLVERLLDQPDPAAFLVQNRQPLPRCLMALVAMYREQAEQLGQQDLVAQLRRIDADAGRTANKTVLRPMVRGGATLAATTVAHGLCRSSDFDDPDFLRCADAMRLGAEMRDPQARDRVQWENVALARHITAAGRPLPGLRVLAVPDAPQNLRVWLRGVGAAVTEGDGRDGRCSAPFDVILFHRLLDADSVAAVLGTAARQDTTVLFCGDVALNGAPSIDAPRPHQLELDLLARAGLVAAAPVHQDVDDEVLEACADRPERATARPHLCALVGAQLRTSFVLRAALAARAPQGPAATHAAATPRQPRWRIGIDLRTLFQADSTARGIGHYTVQHLSALSELTPDVTYVGYVPRANDRLPPTLQRANVTTVAIDDYRPDDVDLVHLPDPLNLSLGFDSPLRVLRHPRTTVTFHDLTPLHHYIAHWPRGNRAAYLDRLRQLEHSDCRLLTNSAFTKKDLLEHLDIAPERVTPILAGLHRTDDHGDATRFDQVCATLGIDAATPFALHIGALDPHKNFYRALNAFLLARSQRPLQLVVVGAVDPGIARAAAFCAARNVKDVHFTGYLPRPHLDALYERAAALLFLSRAEGFGFPILEAMGKGCPVVASDATSHPEVAGDAAVLVDPDDQDGAARALLRLCDDASFANELRARGRRRSAAFPWRAVAERTLAVWQPWLDGTPLAPGRRHELAVTAI